MSAVRVASIGKEVVQRFVSERKFHNKYKRHIRKKSTLLKKFNQEMVFSPSDVDILLLSSQFFHITLSLHRRSVQRWLKCFVIKNIVKIQIPRWEVSRMDALSIKIKAIRRKHWCFFIHMPFKVITCNLKNVKLC